MVPGSAASFTDALRPESWTGYPVKGGTAMLLEQIPATPDDFDRIERIGRPGLWQRR